MAASVESRGGTTLEMMMPSTSSRSSPREREQIAEQDAPLIGRLVVDRAQAPVTLTSRAFEGADGDIVLPASRARTAGRTPPQGPGSGSIVLADQQKSLRVEARQ